MERRREPRQEKPDTGRMGFRYPDEPPDERPVIALRQFWKDDAEREVYESAVRNNPRVEGEGPMGYVERIAAIAASRLGRGVRSMPRPRQSRREKDAALLKLRFQAKDMGGVDGESGSDEAR